MSPTIHGLLVLALASFPASLLAQTLEGQSQQAREALGAASGALNGLAAKAQAAGASGKVVGTTPVSKPGDYWETGTILGRPVKLSYKGLVKTWEGVIMCGQFDHDPNFAVGSTFEVSIKNNPEMVKKFQSLDPKKNYVFKYNRPHPMNPIWEDTKYLITDAIEAKTPADLPKSFPAEVATSGGRRGAKSEGDIEGHIISVERWGYGSKVCTIELVTGGIKAGGKESASDLHAVGYAVYSEEACQAAEAAMLHQASVSLHYTEDYVEMWDCDSHVCHSMKVKVAPLSSMGAPTTVDEYEALKLKLLRDPAFLEQLRIKLNKTGR